MNWKNKIIRLFQSSGMIMLLFLSALYVSSVSAYDFEVGGIYYSLKGNEVSVASSPYPIMYSGSVDIPPTVAYNNRSYPVTSISNYAFYNCDSLTSISIPYSVTSISSDAFYNCAGLISIKVESGNPNYDSRNNCNSIIVTATNKLILGCTNSIIPNSVTSIGYAAFSGSGLTSISIPGSVTSIESNAFSFCRDLTSVRIPTSVTSIGRSVFSGCRSLTSIEVESGNSYYDSRNNCNAIINTATNTLEIGCRNSSIPNSVTSIGYAAFSGSGLTRINLPNSVTSIGSWAFDDCFDLISVSIPNSVTDLGYGVFSDCYSLTSVTIPNSISSIYSWTFYDCNSLTRITIPNSVTTIDSNAFDDCSGLTSVTIGSGVNSIGYDAFNNCSALATVKCLGVEPPVMSSSDCFMTDTYQNAKLLVPRYCEVTYAAAPYWYKFIHIESFDDESTGDVNGDGEVNIADINAVIDMILSSRYNEAGDVNGDGEVNIADINSIIDIILNQ